MARKRDRKSRRETPWDIDTELTATQAFLKEYYDMHYLERHRKLSKSGEADMINSYQSVNCPYCGSLKFKKFGHSRNGVQRYMCRCGKTFLPTTGTIFDEHRISISEWMEYCLNLFRHVSITADSWSNKNAFTTSRYWLQKLFLTLEDVQDDIVLSEYVWFDETFCSVRADDIERREDGEKLRGVSRNQICIGVATDKQNTLLFAEGTGKPTQKRTFDLFGDHIRPGSTLIHDNEMAHNKLVKDLSLVDVSYDSKELKGLTDSENPLNPVNRVHAVLKRFLSSHSGFMRRDIQGYLNLFALVSNPPYDPLEKMEKVIKMAFRNPKMLRYRDYFAANSEV
jgi:predicted RNA-binding Zn-ribbon protein involved in translation (DUF1610 family)